MGDVVSDGDGGAEDVVGDEDVGMRGHSDGHGGDVGGCGDVGTPSAMGMGGHTGDAWSRLGGNGGGQ